MPVVAFDTLKFVETLEEAGAENRVAKAISRAVRDSHEAANLVTKAELRVFSDADLSRPVSM